MSLSEPSVRLRFVAAVLCAILALAGCSAEDDTDAEEGAAASEGGEGPRDPRGRRWPPSADYREDPTVPLWKIISTLFCPVGPEVQR